MLLKPLVLFVHVLLPGDKLVLGQSGTSRLLIRPGCLNDRLTDLTYAFSGWPSVHIDRPSRELHGALRLLEDCQTINVSMGVYQGGVAYATENLVCRMHFPHDCTVGVYALICRYMEV